ncbi:hypothetical protein VP01_2061g3 [Puccinia sorghi]|uniref:Uncharacterized protein n=1 Tax=Puccinia sorghi TaxID=27349 RepID=A0A0L6VAT6_9BASI|nr:hypothetical protein VP01_2061g3 [Puccinia sorghi]
MDTSIAPTGVSFLTPSSSPARSNNFFNPRHHRSNSLTGLVRRKSHKMKSLLPTATTTNSQSTAVGPELTSIISRGFARASAEVPRRAEPSSDIRPSQRHSINSTQIIPPPFPISTLPIIQPRTTATWNSSYDLDRRCFKVSLHNPRQQVTSLLALSSIPRPLTPPFDEERENTASVILAATRTAIEEEAIQAAIAASLQPDPRRRNCHTHDQSRQSQHHWADHRRSHVDEPSQREYGSTTPIQSALDHEPNSRTTIELDWTEGPRMARMAFAVPDDDRPLAVGTGSSTLTRLTTGSPSSYHSLPLGKTIPNSVHQELLQQQLSYASFPSPSLITPTQANPFPGQQQSSSNSRAFSNTHCNSSSTLLRPSQSTTRIIHPITKINKTNHTHHSSPSPSPSSSDSSDSPPHSSPSASSNSSLISSNNSFLLDSPPCPSFYDSPIGSRFSNPTTPSRSPPQTPSPSHRKKLTRESDQLPIPNITESNVSPSANHHEQRGPHTDHVSFQLSPTSLSQNLSPTSMTHSSLSLASPALHSSTTSIRPVISPSSSTHPSPVKPTMPAEMFIIVRPPPGKQNHPLNLQVQLILPNQNVMSREPSTSTTNGLPGNSSPSHSQIFSGRPISSAPETIDGSTDHSLQLKRTQSIRSIHSSRSSRSHRTCSSGSESRNRRVTPLYNLQWHTVLPTWISDAGTDAKVAKFAKKGLELIDLANIEPSEIRSGRYPSDLNLLLNGGPISPPSHVAIPHSNASGGTANSNPNQKTDRPAAAALFNKVRKLGVFNKKGGSKMEAGLTANPAAKKVAGTRNSDQFTHNDLPSTNGGLSTVGPLIEAGGRRATGYAWIVRKWNKPEIVDWQNSAPKTNQISPVLVEWRKAKKRARVPPKTKSHPERSSSNPSHTVAPPPPDPTPVTAPSAQAVPEDPSPPEPHAPDSALKLFTIPAAVTTIGVMNFLGRFTKAVEPSPAPEPSPEEAPEPLRATAEQTPKPSRTTTLESSTSVRRRRRRVQTATRKTRRVRGSVRW